MSLNGFILRAIQGDTRSLDYGPNKNYGETILAGIQVLYSKYEKLALDPKPETYVATGLQEFGKVYYSWSFRKAVGIPIIRAQKRNSMEVRFRV